MPTNRVSREKIDAVVIEAIVEQCGVRRSEVTRTAHIIDNLGADSLDIVEIVMVIEEKLGITISDEDARELHTVGDTLDYLYKATQVNSRDLK